MQRLRFLGVLAVIAAIAVVDVCASSALATPKGSGLSISQPCTYLTAKQIQRVVRAPVAIDPTNRGNNGFITAGCTYFVGPTDHPTGALVVTIVYPYFPTPGQTAVDVVQTQRAGVAASGFLVEDAKTGRASYVDVDHSVVGVAASKKFAFSLQWLATGGPTGGGPLDAATQKHLIALAKQIVGRSPK